jgi:hypothetical protein
MQVQSGRVWVSMISLSTGKLPDPYEAEQGKKGAPRRARACNLLDSHKLEK